MFWARLAPPPPSPKDTSPPPPSHTHYPFRINRLPHFIFKESKFHYRYVRLCDLAISREKLLYNFANSGDSDGLMVYIWSGLGLFANYPLECGGEGGGSQD